MKKFAIINGPNLNLTGKREPHIYGTETFSQLLSTIHTNFPEVEIDYTQSNSEGEIINKIHQHITNHDIQGIIINPGAYAHYSFAIADALAMCNIPIVEVHLSNIFAREEHRHKSVTAPHTSAFIAGMGMNGYISALLWLMK